MYIFGRGGRLCSSPIDACLKGSDGSADDTDVPRVRSSFAGAVSRKEGRKERLGRALR